MFSGGVSRSKRNGLRGFFSRQHRPAQVDTVLLPNENQTGAVAVIPPDHIESDDVEILLDSQNPRSDDRTIQLMSDLHLETIYISHHDGKRHIGYEEFDCGPVSSNLALLGDIGTIAKPGYFQFLRSQLRLYKRILYVMGNHEYYASTVDAVLAQMRTFSEEVAADDTLGEFVLLDRSRYDLNDSVTILGCTLWSHVPDEHVDFVSSRLSDFANINDWNVTHHNAAFARDAEWLDLEVNRIHEEEPHRRIIVFTHHAPSMEGTRSARHVASPIGYAFATDMTARDCWGAPVALWAFGHTHFNVNFEKKGVRLVSNQKGYGVFESHDTKFIPSAIIDVDSMKLWRK